jgi:O-methyltransferase involved in polyketide biosynthesis
VDVVSAHDLGGVAETLLIPLWCKAEETKRSDALLRDPLASRIIERLDYDFSVVAQDTNKRYLQPSVALRAREFDKLVRAFMATHPGTVVVDLGCGLDTRYWRVDDGRVQWYDLDLPGVISLRRQLLDETARCTFVSCSVLDFGWMEAVGPGDRPHMFVAEALLPYLEGRDVERLVRGLRRRFPGCELVFDALPAILVPFSSMHPALRNTSARLRWTPLRDRELERWGRGIRLLHSVRYIDKPQPRLGWGQLLRFVPGMRGRTRILHYRLGAL